MLIRFKCDNCGAWHHVDDVATANLIKLLYVFTEYPPEPFNRREWLLILKAEITRRSRGSQPA